MRDRDCKVDMSHTFATDNAPRHLHSTLLTYHSGVAHSFILAAETLEVLRRSEDTFTEETIRLRTLRAVVNGLWLGDLSARPSEDVFGGGNRKRHGIEAVGRCGLLSGRRRHGR
jgi:hypothetical protein